MNQSVTLESLQLHFPSAMIGRSLVIHANCFDWLQAVPENTLHAMVTDPPYGLKEYEYEQIAKRNKGEGGIWRIPPSFDGHERSPLPRFTALNAKERGILKDFLSNGDVWRYGRCAPEHTYSSLAVPFFLKWYSVPLWRVVWSFVGK